MGPADLLTALRGQAHALVALPGLLASADELLDSLRVTARRASWSRAVTAPGYGGARPR